jgi:hypothetical protein
MEAERIKHNMKKNRWPVEQPSKSKTTGARGLGLGWTLERPSEEISLTFYTTVPSRGTNCRKVLDASEKDINEITKLHQG